MEQLSRSRITYCKVSLQIPRNGSQERKRCCEKAFSEVALLVIPLRFVKALI